MKLNLLFFLLLPALALGQSEFPFPPLSPTGEVIQQVGNTSVKVHYERPSARGRKIYGGLVPWNKVWRTGAGMNTKISFSKDVRLGGQAVPKGTYSLFTIPNPDKWMVILNRDTTLYGAYDYDSNKDQVRFFTNPSKTARFYESLTIDVDLVPNNARIYISWTNTQISFDLETSSDKEAMEYIEKYLLTGKDPKSDNYSLGADYLFFHDKDMMNALKLAPMGLERNPMNLYAASVLVNMFEKLGYYAKAVEAMDRVIKITETREYDDEKYRPRDIEQAKNRKEALKAKIKEQD